MREIIRSLIVKVYGNKKRRYTLTVIANGIPFAIKLDNAHEYSVINRLHSFNFEINGNFKIEVIGKQISIISEDVSLIIE